MDAADLLRQATTRNGLTGAAEATGTSVTLPAPAAHDELDEAEDRRDGEHGEHGNCRQAPPPDLAPPGLALRRAEVGDLDIGCSCHFGDRIVDARAPIRESRSP